MCECPRKVGIVGSLTGQWQILAERCITFPKPHPPPPARVTIPQVQGKGGRWDAIQASSPCRRSSKHLSPAVGRQSWGCLSVGGMQASKHLWTGMLRWRGLVIGKMICLPITAAMEGQKGGGRAEGVACRPSLDAAVSWRGSRQGMGHLLLGQTRPSTGPVLEGGKRQRGVEGRETGSESRFGESGSGINLGGPF